MRYAFVTVVRSNRTAIDILCDTFSVSAASINLYCLTSAVKAILISIRASFIPMHDLGPYPNGMCASGCLFSFSSFENLYLILRHKDAV